VERREEVRRAGESESEERVECIEREKGGDGCTERGVSDQRFLVLSLL